jgi:ER membrane protein complex subunit 1
LIGLQKLISFTTRLESTSQVFAYGHDLFLARIMPDNGYDLLDESFSYVGLFAFIILLIVGDFALSRYLKTLATQKAFLTR